MDGDNIDLKAVQSGARLNLTNPVMCNPLLYIAKRVLEDARRSISMAAGHDGWGRLTQEEKAYICRSVVAGLIDKERASRIAAG